MGGRFQRRETLCTLLALCLWAGPAAAQQTAMPKPGAAPPPGSPGIVTNPEWITRPRTEVPPSASEMNLREGRVELGCTSQPTGEVTDCAVTYETPIDVGLGEAALASMTGASPPSMSPRTVDGVAQPTRVLFVFEFASATTPPRVSSPALPRPAGEPVLISSPSWARQPLPDFPAVATAREIAYGEAILNCGFLSNGDLVDCRIDMETPSDVGFGASTLRAAARGRLAPRTMADKPAGSRVQFRTRFASGA